MYVCVGSKGMVGFQSLWLSTEVQKALGGKHSITLYLKCCKLECAAVQWTCAGHWERALCLLVLAKTSRQGMLPYNLPWGLWSRPSCPVHPPAGDCQQCLWGKSGEGTPPALWTWPVRPASSNSSQQCGVGGELPSPPAASSGSISSLCFFLLHQELLGAGFFIDS